MPDLKIVNKLLVLVALTSTVLFGWLAGHILRFSIPSYQYQHPPIAPEIKPHIENGYQIEGIRRQAVLMGNPVVRIFTAETTLPLEGLLLDQCVGNTYYTSLPAKCRSANGELTQVGGNFREIILLPDNGLEK